MYFVGIYTLFVVRLLSNSKQENTFIIAPTQQTPNISHPKYHITHLSCKQTFASIESHNAKQRTA